MKDHGIVGIPASSFAWDSLIACVVVGAGGTGIGTSDMVYALATGGKRLGEIPATAADAISTETTVAPSQAAPIPKYLFIFSSMTDDTTS